MVMVMVMMMMDSIGIEDVCVVAPIFVSGDVGLDADKKAMGAI